MGALENRSIWKNMRCQRLFAVLAGIISGLAVVTTAHSQSQDALLNKLVEKGILTTAEADELKEESLTNSAGGAKFTLGNSIKSMEFFGDLKLRYEYRSAAFGPGTAYAGDSDALNRWRYALRFGVRGDLADDFYYGLRFETSPNPRSPWETFGGSSGSQAPYQGPFSKANNYGLFVGQAYLGWRPYDWLDISAGRVRQPLYTTAMVWDSDYCPEGAVEKIKYTAGRADFFGNFCQFIYQDVNPTTGGQVVGVVGSTPSASYNPFMLAWQAGLTYNFKTNLSAKIAPVLYNYIGHGNGASGFAGPFVGQGSSLGLNYTSLLTTSSTLPGTGGNGYNQTGINNLFVLDIPAEFNFKLASCDARLFGDFAINFEGNDRARAAYNGGETEAAAYGLPNPFPAGAQLGQDKAYQIGFALGNNLGLVYGTTSRKGTWETRVYWQYVQQYALDVNLMDSDFFEGRGNLEGIYAACAYSFTDAIIGTLRYGYAERINSNLGTGGFNADLPLINPVDKYNLVQADLTLRF
jgi:hypothetical protein